MSLYKGEKTSVPLLPEVSSVKNQKPPLLSIDSEKVIKKKHKGKYYIISLLVPLVVFLFALIVLCFFIISPILEGYSHKIIKKPVQKIMNILSKEERQHSHSDQFYNN